jgi:hypothetical protein
MNDTQLFLKGKTVIKGPPKRKLRANIVQVLDDLKDSKSGVFEGYSKNHNWTQKKLSLGTPVCKSIDTTP